jgi:hypothetical protein
MSEALIAELVETRLLEWAELQEVPIAFEDVPFTPPTKAIYARVKHLPATTTTAFLDGKHKAFIGLWQVSIVCPSGNGVGPGRRVAMTLSDYFPPNLVLQKSSFRMQINSPVSVGPVIVNDTEARSTLPCSFTYRADTIS